MKKQKQFKLTKKELQFLSGLVVATFVYIVSYPIIFGHKFISNCIIEWPIRWDVKNCWNEQKEPTKERALENAAVFL